MVWSCPTGAEGVSAHAPRTPGGTDRSLDALGKGASDALHRARTSKSGAPSTGCVPGEGSQADLADQIRAEAEAEESP